MDSVTDAPAEVYAEQRRQARIDMAAAHRIAVVHDFHEAVDNHFTLRVPGRPNRYYLNRFGLHWSEVTASNLIEIDYDGNVVEGEGPADRSAICIHTPIHEIANVECVLHTHMPYVTALSQLEDMTIEMTGQGALQFNDRVAYDYDYNGFAHEHEEGERMARLMDGKPILMLANHGVVVTGKTVAQAYHRLYFIERACRTQLFTMWTGQRRRFVKPEILAKIQEQATWKDPTMKMSGAEYHFAALKRLLDKSQPDYAD
ncbi:class II aldolase/adducin family protein [Roseococcus sp. YIM B11640]|uniref:class II aldolase/adducin family protein n=1 Tax=Roseococcus sp. YIM B11640 TaxID=3133973 RepID=UPI003C7C8C63